MFCLGADKVQPARESRGNCVSIQVTSRGKLFPWVIFFLILATSSLTTCAQAASPSPTPTPANASPTPQPSSTPTLERQFFKNVLSDQRAIWTSPLHLHGEDAKWLIPLGVTTAGLIATDRQTADAITDEETLQHVSHVISVFGSGYTTAG